MFVELLNYFSCTYANVFGLKKGPPLHDPLAVAAVLPPSAGFFDDRSEERFEVDVILQDGETGKNSQIGRIVVHKLKAGEKGVKIPRTIDTEKFWNELNACLARAEARVEEQAVI